MKTRPKHTTVSLSRRTHQLIKSGALVLGIKQRVFIAKLQHNLFSPEEHNAILQSWLVIDVRNPSAFVTLPISPELWDELNLARDPHESFHQYLTRRIEQFFPEVEQ